MTASSIDQFVRDMLEREDCRTLTMRKIRESYEKEMNVELNDEQKKLMKEIVEILFTEKMNETRKSEGGADDDDDDKEPETKIEPIKKKRKRIDSSEESGTDGKADNDVPSDAPCFPPAKKKARNSKNSTAAKKETKKSPKKKTQKSDSEEESTKDPATDSDDDCDETPKKSLQIKKTSGRKSSNIKAKRTPKKGKVSCDESSDDDDDAGDEDKEDEDKDESEGGNADAGGSEAGSKSGGDDDEELKPNEKKKMMKKKKTPSLSSGDDEKETKKEVSKKSKRAKKPKENDALKKGSKQEEKSKQLKYYEKIARACGVMPVGKRHKTVFESCSTEGDRMEKLKQILRDAGMTGRISMEEAEKLKLQREAAELGANNIIGTEGRSRRNVFSVYSRHEYNPVAKNAPEVPLKEQLSRLKDIVDSDSD